MFEIELGKFLLLSFSVNLLLFSTISGSAVEAKKPGYYDGFNSVYWATFDHEPKEILALCKTGTRQSPIDIPAYDNVRADYAPFRFRYYDKDISGFTLTNNGHTAKLSYAPSFKGDVERPAVNGGGLGVNFEFAQLHFHWGNVSAVGSEHTFNGRRYPLEMHLVHFNTKYGSTLNEAVVDSDGAFDTLAVIGVMFHLQNPDNPEFDNIFNKLPEVEQQGTKAKVAPFALEDVLPVNVGKFYRYSGSLTTPGCNEIVLWTLFKQSVGISERQLMKLRNLSYGKQSTEPLVNNYRSLQPLRGRQIFETSSAIANSVSLVSLTLVALLAGIMN